MTAAMNRKYVVIIIITEQTLNPEANLNHNPEHNPNHNNDVTCQQISVLRVWPGVDRAASLANPGIITGLNTL